MYNKSLSDFALVDDDNLMHLLEEHFQVLDTNDYEAKLKAVYMVPADQVDIPKIQLYTQTFLNVLVNNPSYQDPDLGGGTNKQINSTFIAGFQPSGFRMLVKDMGTESFQDTLSKLNNIYADIRTTIRVQRRLGNLIIPNSPTKDAKTALAPAAKRDASSSKPSCSSTQCSGRSLSGAPHKPDQCWILHPEKRPANQSQGTPKPETTPKKVFIASRHRRSMQHPRHHLILPQ